MAERPGGGRRSTDDGDTAFATKADINALSKELSATRDELKDTRETVALVGGEVKNMAKWLVGELDEDTGEWNDGLINQQKILNQRVRSGVKLIIGLLTAIAFAACSNAALTGLHQFFPAWFTSPK